MLPSRSTTAMWVVPSAAGSTAVVPDRTPIVAVRAVAGKVGGSEKPAHALGERADRDRDVATVEPVAGGADPGEPVPSAQRLGVDESPQRAGERRLHEELAHLGRPPARKEYRGPSG